MTLADDVHAVSRDWQTYSSERGGITALTNAIMPLELIQAMFIGMDPPKHDRLKALFQRGFTPKRIAEHEDAIREITVEVLDRLDGRETCDLVDEVAQPVVARVIGSFMGIPPEDDIVWARLMNNTLGAGEREGPEDTELIMQEDVPEIFERCRKLIEERRETPTDDLTSVLVHAEVDGETLEEHEIVMGFFLLMAAGNDSTKATYCSGMRALIENPEERAKVVADPELIPSMVEESLRMFPAFAHFRRTATSDVELNGRQIAEGDKVVMWYVSSNRDESRYADPDRFDVDPQPRAPGVRRRRPPLLPRRGAGAARAADPVRGDAQALPRDGARRPPGVRRLPVREPAPHAPGHARPPRRVARRAALPPHPARHARVAVVDPRPPCPPRRTFTVAWTANVRLGAGGGRSRSSRDASTAWSSENSSAGWGRAPT